MNILNLGLNNKIENADIIKQGVVSIKGNDNTVLIPKNLQGICNINILGNGHHIQIEDGVKISKKLSINVFDNNGYVYIGKDTTIVDLTILVNENNNKVEIGQDCMFSRGITIQSTDSHSIISLEDGNCINYATRGVIIKDHVWVGLNATILKDTIINKNTIIAASAVVSGEIAENVVAGGVPAKIIKSNVTWSREKPIKNIPGKEIENFKEILDSNEQKTCIEEMFPSIIEGFVKKSIIGWTYVIDKNSYNTKIYTEITLKDETIRTFEATSAIREDVSNAFKNEKYANSGFKVILPSDINVEDIAKIRVICDNNGQITSNTVVDKIS